MSDTVFVVVPAYNEAAVLRQALVPLVERGYEVVVVDDGSTDHTWSVLHHLPVHALRHRVNLGQGAALQTGMTFSLKHGASYIVHFDADGQHQIEDIEVLLEPLRAGDADIVMGSRFLRSADSKAVPFKRRMLLRGGVYVNYLLTGLRLSDAHNGFRAMTAHAARCIELRENGFAHASEILLRVRQHGLRYLERPTLIQYTEYSRAKGQSSLNAVRIVIDLVIRRIFR